MSTWDLQSVYILFLFLIKRSIELNLIYLRLMTISSLMRLELSVNFIRKLLTPLAPNFGMALNC